MEMGIWTPVPHAVHAEPRLDAAVAMIQRAGEGAGADTGLQFAIDLLQEAERLGFTRTLIAERWLGPDLEAWMLAAALAMHTKAMELIVAVHPGIVSPQCTAKMAATLDRMSGGRAAVNIVNGWWQDEFDLFSNGAWLDRSDDRYDRADEFMQVLIRLWTNDGRDFAGRYYQMKNPRLPSTPLTRPYPPIYTASMSPAGKESIARYGDYWFVTPRNLGSTHEDFESVATEIEQEIDKLREAAAKHGRRIRFGVSGHVVCAPTREAAHRRIAELEAYGKRGMLNFIVSRATGNGLVGTPEMIAKRLDHYEAIGCSFTMLHFHPMIEGAQRFAEDVMPLLNRSRAIV